MKTVRQSIIVSLSFAVILTLGACTGNISSRTAREQIAALGGASLDVDDVAIQRMVTELGDRAIAEALVRLTFQFERDGDGEWRIVAARLGDRQWIDIDDLMSAIEAQNVRDTAAALQSLSSGITAYSDETGGLPSPPPTGRISDVLHPLFMDELVRDDAWGSSIVYQVRGQTFELRSAGPDRIAGSSDDIVWPVP